MKNQSNPDGVEIIEAISPHESPQKKKDKKSSFPWKPLFLFLFLAAFLFGCGILLLQFVQSKSSNKITQVESPAPTPPATPPSPPVPLKKEIDPKLREGALTARAEYDYQKSLWDLKRASEWSLDAYSNAVTLAQTAEKQFEVEAYIKSSNTFIQASQQLEKINGEQEQAIKKLILEGRIALKKGEGEKAKNAFELILLLDPTHEFAQQNIKRAQVATRVYELIKSGKALERNNNKELALIDYREAMKLDPEAMDARVAINRIKQQIAKEEFQRLISEGLRALAKGELDIAENRLKKAHEFFPESAEVKDALLQVENALLKRRLETIHKAAKKFEATEAWEEALKKYNQALLEDPAIEFARTGKKRCVQQIDLNKAALKFIQNPELLLRKKQAQYAQKLLGEYQTLDFRGNTLSASMSRLEKLLKDAQTPVSVLLESDAKTEIVIYKIGKIGKVKNKSILLKPAIYVFVGSRKGFQDVRKEITIQPNSTNQVIQILCTNKF